MTDVTTSEYGSDTLPTRILGAGETLNVARQAGIYNQGTGSAIEGAGANTVNLPGGLYAAQSVAGSFLFGNNVFTLGAQASVVGGVGLGFSGTTGNNTVTNGGQIVGFVSAIIFSSDQLAVNNVVNNLAGGTIRAGQATAIYGYGLKIDNDGIIESGQSAGSSAIAALAGGSTIDNSGTIRGVSTGVYVGASTTQNLVTNTGLIAATINGTGVLGDGAIDKVVNQGTIQGAGPVKIAVNLAANHDIYIGTGGKLIGEVRGGIGNDSLTGGSFADILRGEADNDTLNGAGGADFLDGGTGNDTFQLGADASDTIGDASGIDTVTSTITRSLTWGFIETLILQGAANINGTGNALGNSIVGNGANNTLAGLGGNDVLVGGGGNDTLFCQDGKDSLTGGANNDRFTFQAVAHTATGNGDVIVDLDDSGDDLIDLTGIIPGVLTFIGGAAFTAANQVRYQQAGANVLVQINTAGPNVADGEITLLNTTIGNAAIGQVNAADFLL